MSLSALRSAGFGLLAVVVSAAAVGCGSSSSDGSSGSTGSSTSAATTGGGDATAAAVTEAKKYIADNAPGVRGELPSSAPKSDKPLNVWAISCDNAASGCSNLANGVKEAADALGWKGTVADGKSDPTRMSSLIDQARLAGANAIVLVAVDCGAVKAALQRAIKAGIIIEGATGYDCDDPTQGGGQPLFTHSVEPAPGEENWQNGGRVAGGIAAAWSVVHYDGKVKAVQLVDTVVAVSRYTAEGFKTQLAKCSTCQMLGEVPFPLTQLGPKLTQVTRTTLLKYPNANLLEPPSDPFAQAAAAGVQAAGKADKVAVTGLLGSPANIELIKNDRGQAMSVGWDVRWLGWASVDDILRIHAKQKPVFSGWAPGIVDKDHLPKGTIYEGPVDYRSNYKKIWGVQ